jgi:2-dehydro-3-deoxyphosphooctonate aldolase (KDO 8-P synthase)
MTDTVPEPRFTIGDAAIGPERLFLIAGPCVIESRELCLEIARAMKTVCAEADVPYVFKASYDKANRSSVCSYRGPGLEEGLDILAEVRRSVGVPVVSDVHCVSQVVPAAAVLDGLQVPAFLSRQTDLLQAAARSGKPVNVKKSQMMAPPGAKNVVEKLLAAGGRKILLTERGTAFGYNNLVSDMRSIPLLAACGCPVVYDATHSAQLPGAVGTASGGQRDMVPVLARAAVAAGCHGLFLEVHPDPDKALSDGPNSLPLDAVPNLLAVLLRIRDGVGPR